MPSRDERREYDGDVTYAVWRSGGNVDRIDFDRVSDHYYEGNSADYAAHAELTRQRPEPEPDYPEPDYEEAPDA